jgi:FPC/CPF motif-containing protein YcgG
MRLYCRTEIEHMPPTNWERAAYDDFKSIVTNKEKLFPCTLGVAGFSANQLRFGFIPENIDISKSSRRLAAILQSFLPNARAFAKNTSLVVFFEEARDLGTSIYENIFWEMLNQASALDSTAWPANIPLPTNNPLWEFSFAGEPIFVVCNTPSHKLRKSRYSKNFVITFQPRWVFEGVIGAGAPNSDRIKSEIRRRLNDFDQLPASPDLGSYGDVKNHEWKQYFLKDDNQPRAGQCPFRKNKILDKPRVLHTGVKDLGAVVSEFLPPTGSVEIQYDSPFREHKRHIHPVDETLHIIEGEITFEYEEISFNCKSGDRLLLPSNTPHQSTAGESGCLYAIATRLVIPESSGKE